MKGSSRDPYLLVEDEIRASLKRIEEEVYDDKLEGLIRSNTVTGALKKMQQSLESAEMQVNELSKAVEASVAAPERFNLTEKEVKTRKNQIEDFKATTARYHERITDLFEAARLSKRASEASAPPQRGIVSSYMNDETDRTFESQQMLMRRQDEDLDDLSVAARRVGEMGLQIGGEIELQTTVIGELEEEVDTTKARLTTARNMINKLGRKMGKWQSVVMAGLAVLLLILMMIAFS
ncbi:t-SNARE coiled-coil homology domain-containing protein [Chloropicon primus]|uniref:t-SNARE coiled-coil homology domain-containing protein n=2 Tax=Chloropicon primus TaxID=1764295 RepID=A0A5B8MZC1_9CHLO|nr:hypothetical protein A3770_18p82190 [Chloropicon primus]UPR04897.1 t-SNARE coiled-coil homology domain-containing protein [Chloropicon primus]|eukprot:QDZ25701.1 hypothetical protein A3770_18p82190 [Chloropicon primus]